MGKGLQDSEWLEALVDGEEARVAYRKDFRFHNCLRAVASAELAGDDVRGVIQHILLHLCKELRQRDENDLAALQSRPLAPLVVCAHDYAKPFCIAKGQA